MTEPSPIQDILDAPIIPNDEYMETLLGSIQTCPWVREEDYEQ